MVTTCAQLIKSVSFGRATARLRTVQGLALFACGLAIVGSVRPAEAGCTPGWLPGDGFNGTSYFVYATTLWDPDGAGRLPEMLVAGGSFLAAGDTLASRVAGWDGAAWHALGTEMEGSVFALAVHNGELIAAGNFYFPRPSTLGYIARWDGTAWRSLGAGVNNWVYSLTVYNGELIAGGDFTEASGVPANHIARWNGTIWQPLGSGVSHGASTAPVNALTVYRGELIAGGKFITAGGVSVSNIARWNGTVWQPLGTGMPNSVVTALTVHDGELIAGGGFTTAGGAPANHIARWNGSAWQAVGTGMNTTVRALAVYNGDLIAGGEFTTAGGMWICPKSC